MDGLSPAPLEEQEITARGAFCLDTIRSAGRLAVEGFNSRSAGDFEMKGPQDYLTETDLAVETLIRERIAAGFPGDGFLGEETGGDVGGDFWVVDPIDGTANFARGIPHFCVSIAFVSGGVIQIGSIFNPSTDDLYFAQKGRGAFLNDKRIEAAATRDIAQATFEIGWSNRLPNQPFFDIVENLYTAGANVRRAASGALGLAYVADGRSDGYAELHMNAWDCLAGFLLVEEAGGVIGGFIENGALHEGGAVLAACPAVAECLSQSTGIAIAG